MDIDHIVDILQAVGLLGMILSGILLISVFTCDIMDKAKKILEELRQIKEKLDKKD